MRTVKFGLLALAGVAGAAAAQPQPGEEARLRPAWEKLDANHDGKVTLDELPAQLAGALRGNDLDRDGSISPAEYVAFDHDPAGSARMPLTDNVHFIANLNYAGTSDWRQ